MLNITHYQRNANQNHNKVSSNPGQNGCYQEIYTPMHTLSLTKEAQICNGVNQVSSTRDAGENAQLRVKERNWKTFEHHTEK